MRIDAMVATADPRGRDPLGEPEHVPGDRAGIGSRWQVFCG